jgi:[ribosomal protein S5]-alanine N-acetyltransferase
MVENSARKNIIETPRLVLRHFRSDDAEAVFEYASNPLIGEGAGWPAHSSVENSRDIIENILMEPDNYAITIKGEDKAIGSAGLRIASANFGGINEDEAELGYWIGQPYWGNGYVPEVAAELLDYGFNDLGLSKIYCGYFDTNAKSARVSEKVGFNYEFTQHRDDGIVRIVNSLTKQQWEHKNGR